MIVFKSIKWKNFLSTGNVFTEINLADHRTTLVVGDNGAGKSTFLDALSFALYGKPFRKINKPQLVNTITQKNLLVEVEFSIGSAEYKVVRGMRPNLFEVYKNGELVNQSAEMKDYQEILEKQIIKANHKSFCQVVILGSASFQPFMQLAAYYRREFIEDMLDLQIFTAMNSILKSHVQLNSDSLAECLTDKKVIEEKIKLIAENVKKSQASSEHLIDEKKIRIAEAASKIEELTSEKKKLEEEILRLRVDASDYSDHKKRLNKFNNLKYKIESNIDHVRSEIAFFRDHDDCPTCKQRISAEFKSEAVSTRESEVQELTSGLSELVLERDRLNDKLDVSAALISKINELQLDVHTIDVRLASINSYFAELNAEVVDITKTIDVEDDKLLIEELNFNLTEVEKKYNELFEEKKVLAVASGVLKDGGIKSKIVKQYIPIINKLINKYLAAMDFYVSFELDEEFNETIKSRYRDVFSYASFSEGEKMRIDLAILFTWRAMAKLRNSINTNVLILDEVLDSSLDSAGTEDFLKIISQLTNDTNTFIISHKTDQIVDKFNHVLRFEKYRNFSRIVET